VHAVPDHWLLDERTLKPFELIGRFGTRVVGSLLALVGSASTVLVGVALVNAGRNAVLIFVAACVSGMAFCGMQSFVYAVGANSYTTNVRGAGLGCAQTVSRIGAVLSSILGGAVFAATNVLTVSTMFYVVGALALLVVASFYSLRSHLPGTGAQRA
jgi:MFS family permease